MLKIDFYYSRIVKKLVTNKEDAAYKSKYDKTIVLFCGSSYRFIIYSVLYIEKSES